MSRNLRNELILILAGEGLLIGLIAANGKGLPTLLAILRLALGLVYTLFIPGYVLQRALFPRVKDLDGTERAAFSFILSVAVLAVIALVLNYLPWGIHLWPIVISIGIFIGICLAISTWLRARLLTHDQVETRTGNDLKKWWADQERGNRVVYIILASTLMVVFLTVMSILLLPKSAERFTEFYMLGPEGQAQEYPRQVAVGQTVSLTVGITNREGAAAVYRIQVKAGDQVLTQAGPVLLGNGGNWEQKLEFTPSTAGDDQQILLLLEREGKPSPYRSLRLWINVKPEAAALP
jgi:uncharacterized membrane protein